MVCHCIFLWNLYVFCNLPFKTVISVINSIFILLGYFLSLGAGYNRTRSGLLTVTGIWGVVLKYRNQTSSCDNNSYIELNWAPKLLLTQNCKIVAFDTGRFFSGGVTANFALCPVIFKLHGQGISTLQGKSHPIYVLLIPVPPNHKFQPISLYICTSSHFRAINHFEHVKSEPHSICQTLYSQLITVYAHLNHHWHKYCTVSFATVVQKAVEWRKAKLCFLPWSNLCSGLFTCCSSLQFLHNIGQYCCLTLT